ncbi:Card1-like endonuclease domain-containing protein [Algoriphagus formosus]|uniref:Card1-like endonuclease domain-containing protein n=1 Tax=Algoriphagus formosus TaxID=2007308 RepID=UPI000C2944D4|nr:DUF1887 family CARF protein [Algoriphagus formosus]
MKNKRVVVSLVSLQTIPNVLFIKEKGPVDLHIFITTKGMEKKGVTSQILEACQAEIKESTTIEVDEYNLKGFESNISSKLQLESGIEIFLNLTGGTKIMALGAYNFFLSKFPNSTKVFYLDGGKNQFRQIFPEITENIITHQYKIDLATYLKANGVKDGANRYYETKDILKRNKTHRDYQHSEKILDIFLSSKDHKVIQAINFLHSNGLREKLVKLEEYPGFNNHYAELIRFGFEPTNKAKGWLSTKETKYLTGDWFEEYVLFTLKKIFGFEGPEIGMGVHIYREGSPNEIDILFTYKNSLYFIECKSTISIDDKINNSLYNETLYKAAALKKDFGLYVHTYLFCTDDLDQLNANQKNRAKYLGITLVGANYLKDESKLKKLFDL